MATIKVRTDMSGVDLAQMIRQVKEQLSELSATEWRIVEADLWSSDDVASRQGMARLWRGGFTAETTIAD